jgi:phosphoenolpyruvate carboxykinase (GTP)
MAVDPTEWEREVPLIEEYYRTYGDRTPAALYAELEALAARVAAAK